VSRKIASRSHDPPTELFQRKNLVCHVKLLRNHVAHQREFAEGEFLRWWRWRVLHPRGDPSPRHTASMLSPLLVTAPGRQRAKSPDDGVQKLRGNDTERVTTGPTKWHPRSD